MVESEIALAIQQVLPGAKSAGTSASSFALQNGRRHLTRISSSADFLTLTTGPLSIDKSSSELAAINARLHSESRVVFSLDGAFLITELAKTDQGLESLHSALHQFEQGLAVLSGEMSGITVDSREAGPAALEATEPSASWNVIAGPEGTKVVQVHDKQGSLRAVVETAGTTVQILEPGTHEEETREAVSELLLRSTGQVRFAKACAGSDPEGRWSAWVEASPRICIDDVLTALAIVCRECGAEARALTDVRLARTYCNFSSAWRATRAAHSQTKGGDCNGDNNATNPGVRCDGPEDHGMATRNGWPDRDGDGGRTHRFSTAS